MSALALPPARDERGFILVGVVTFMLALTILGLSLFALSTYEAQFFYASASREQSLQNSESGMEVVKALLDAGPAQLQVAHLAEGQSGITRAIAYQQRSASAADTTSSGPIDWSRDLVIVVTARSGDVERTLQTRFTAQPTDNPYKHLVACGGGLTFDTENSTDPRAMRMTGHVWHPVASDADTAWTRWVTWSSDQPVRRGTPPLSLADAFVDAHWSSARDPELDGLVDLENKDHYEIEFVNRGSSPAFYKLDRKATDAGAKNDPEYDQYSFYSNNYPIELEVRGTAVWLVDQGACFKNVVNVVPESPGVPSTLIIVARANGRDPGFEERALWFQGGLQVSDPNMHVFLVSEHDIAVTHVNAASTSHVARNVSIVAGGRVVLEGPRSTNEFDLVYTPSAMDGLVNRLASESALPALSGGGGYTFAPVPRTWVEITPR
jgi:Tfp pilus assembly protein PilX